MVAYAIGFYNITDASWRDEYREGTMALVEKHGGRFLVRPDCRWEVLEANPPRPAGMVIIEFPSMDAARSWYDDPEYVPLRALRQTGSTLDLMLVESLPDIG